MCACLWATPTFKRHLKSVNACGRIARERISYRGGFWEQYIERLLAERKVLKDAANDARRELRRTGEWEDEASMEKKGGRGSGRKLAVAEIEAEISRRGGPWRR